MTSRLSRRQALAALAGAGAATALPGAAAHACSRVFWNDNPVKLVGRTLDWSRNFDEAMWALPAGMQRAGRAPDNPAKWTSHYASLIIAGLDVCTEEGVNEKGLVVNMLFLDGTQYETRNSKRPGIAFYQWPQFYLDTCATVPEVIANLDQVQVVNTALGKEYPDGLPLHVAVADASGASAIIEFIKGEPTVHLGKEYQVMTNEPAYDKQIANMLRYKAFGGTIERLPGGIQADERFVRAAYTLKYLPKTSDPVQAAASMMSLMNNVSVPFGSPYSGVSGTYPTWYRSMIDPNARVYYVQTTITPNTFWVEMDKLDLSPGATPRKLSIFDEKLMGEASADFKEAKPAV
jgi:penicillin V acylase-like amidase (Ntn superfamily)